MGAAGGAVPAGGHAGGGHRSFTEASAESGGTAARVEAHAHAAVLTRLVALDWLNLAAGALPSAYARALVDVDAPSPVLTGRSAQGREALRPGVVGGTLAGVGPHTPAVVSAGQVAHRCVTASSCPARGTQTLVPAHAAASVGAWRGAHS